MGNIITLIRRELGVYFVSPMAYIVLTAFLLITGYFFYVSLGDFVRYRMPASYVPTIMIIQTLTIFMMPLITMRLVAEEKNRGTIETLMTAPITEMQFVLSKYLASVIFYMILVLPTVFLIYLLSRYAELDYGAVAGGYLSILLFAFALMSIGLFISSLCSSQISAGVITLVISLLLIAANILAENLRGRYQFLRNVLEYIDFMGRTSQLVQGVIDSRDVVFLISVPVLFLFLTSKAIESRRWR
jgi:ABC-2 type transport system permease protein